MGPDARVAGHAARRVGTRRGGGCRAKKKNVRRHISGQFHKIVPPQFLVHYPGYSRYDCWSAEKNVSCHILGHFHKIVPSQFLASCGFLIKYNCLHAVRKM